MAGEATQTGGDLVGGQVPSATQGIAPLVAQSAVVASPVPPTAIATSVVPASTATSAPPAVLATATRVPATVPPAPVVPTAAPVVSDCPQGCNAQQPGCVIKGNINAEGVKIYHVPGGGSYSATVITPANGERWFCTGAEAVASGWRAAQN